MSLTQGTPIVVGLSGGVDSAVSAYLLKAQGYAVTGIFMKNWEDEDDAAYCSTRQDWLDAAAVADLLGIELEVVNFAAEYRERVFATFLREYAAGRTPNPDVLCNAEIKFKAFLDHARALGAVGIATGHYARVRACEGSMQLLRGVDPSKDQSYFLHRLTQAQLACTLFPVGHMLKTEVRALARRIGLPNAGKRDSTGICFIGERPFRAFLGRYLPTTPGPIRSADGRVMGAHQGLSFYTLGQRRGLGIGGQREGSGGAWYTARKDLASNTLWIVQGHDHPLLSSAALRAEDVSWVAGAPPAAAAAPEGLALSAKTRYRQQDAACHLHLTPPGAADGFTLRFAAPQWAATPGQSAVLYEGELCLGGGVIAAEDGFPEPVAPVVSAHPRASSRPAIPPLSGRRRKVGPPYPLGLPSPYR